MSIKSVANDVLKLLVLACLIALSIAILGVGTFFMLEVMGANSFVALGVGFLIGRWSK